MRHPVSADIEELTESEGRIAETMARAGRYRPLPPRTVHDASMLQLLRYDGGIPLTTPGN